MQSIENLIATHVGIAHSIAIQYGTPATLEDLKQEAHIALWKAAQAFDLTRGVPFPAFARVCVRNAVSRVAGKSRKQQLLSLEHPESVIDSNEVAASKTVLTGEALDAVKRKFSTLDREIQRAINDWCGGDSKSEIADREGVGTSAICKRISKGVQQLQFAIGS